MKAIGKTVGCLGMASLLWAGWVQAQQPAAAAQESAAQRPLSWQERNEQRNREVSSSSITRSGGRWDEAAERERETRVKEAEAKARAQCYRTAKNPRDCP